LIIYGTYTEAEFKQLLNQTSLIIWYGRHESQGIALLEALACDLPMIVCDATSVAQEIPTHPYTPEFFNFPVTSAPFFNAQCGLKITDLNQLRLAITEILDTRARFHPRAFILESLSLESQARAFVALWEHWQLSFEDGRTEQCLSSKAFSPTLAFRINQLGTRVQRRLRQSV
jgi:glycosyltransferase involved in cell wall biosynthesis